MQKKSKAPKHICSHAGKGALCKGCCHNFKHTPKKSCSCLVKELCTLAPYKSNQINDFLVHCVPAKKVLKIGKIKMKDEILIAIEDEKWGYTGTILSATHTLQKVIDREGDSFWSWLTDNDVESPKGTGVWILEIEVKEENGTFYALNTNYRTPNIEELKKLIPTLTN